MAVHRCHVAAGARVPPSAKATVGADLEVRWCSVRFGMSGGHPEPVSGSRTAGDVRRRRRQRRSSGEGPSLTVRHARGLALLGRLEVSSASKEPPGAIGARYPGTVLILPALVPTIGGRADPPHTPTPHAVERARSDPRPRMRPP